MYQLTIYGTPFGKPRCRDEAEKLLEAMKHVVKGLEMRRVRQ